MKPTAPSVTLTSFGLGLILFFLVKSAAPSTETKTEEKKEEAAPETAEKKE